MSTDIWGALPKAQDDSTTIDQAIATAILNHDNDSDAHLENGQSLQSHRASEIIDHEAESIVNDKIAQIARAYTAIVKIPDFDLEDCYFPDVSYWDDTYSIVGSLTIPQILGRSVSDADASYFTTKTDFFEVGIPVLPAGKKIYKMTVHVRARVSGYSGLDSSISISDPDGAQNYNFVVNSTWQDYSQDIYFWIDMDDNWVSIDQAILNIRLVNLNFTPASGDPTKDILNVSLMYLTLSVVSDYDSEDFFCLKDAIDYVNGLGGGLIFIKNGTYYCGKTICNPGSYVSIEGESLDGVNLNFNAGFAGISLGAGITPLYTAGTMTLTQGSANVAFSGVTLTSANTVGKYLLNAKTGHFYLITAWIDSTHVTIEFTYQGQTTASLSYLIMPLLVENELSGFTTNVKFTIYGAQNMRLDNIRIENSSFIYSYVENLDVYDCDLYNCSPLYELSYVCNCTFSQNTISHFANAVCYLDITCVGNIINENLCIDNLEQLFLIFGSNNIIKDNVIEGNGWTLGQLYPPILTGSTSLKNIISNNVIRGNNSVGIGSQTGADYNLVIGNVCIDNYSAGIDNNGSHSVTASNIT